MGKFYGIVSAAAISDRDGNGSPVLGPSASLYTGKISTTLEATLLMSAASAMVFEYYSLFAYNPYYRNHAWLIFTY
eukprot:COSAG05_NODE_14247_length_403_cov_0.848684_1_plen_75_part_01